MAEPTDEPLIWTIKGNLPISSLKYRHSWTDTPDEVTFAEEYLLEDEVVKRSVHVYLKHGMNAHAAVGGVN